MTAELTVTFVDDDTPAIVVEPEGGLSVVEGARGAYSVRLATLPTGNVNVAADWWTLSGARLSGGVMRLTFTPDNWYVPQEITVGRGEDANDDNEVYELRFTAAGGGYDEVAAELTVTFVDNDTGKARLPGAAADLHTARADLTGAAADHHTATPGLPLAVGVIGGLNADRIALAPVTPLSGKSPDEQEGPRNRSEESVEESSAKPSLSIVDEEFTLFRRAQLWHSGLEHSAGLTHTGIHSSNRHEYFDAVALEMDGVQAGNLEFAIESSPDISDYKFCHPEERFRNKQSEDGCHDTGIEVHPSGGLLYVFMHGTYTHNRPAFHFVGDYVRHMVELSVEDAGSDLKVYRSVLINPPPEIVDCSDYRETTIERYNCLFLGELIPQSLVTPQEYLDDLPNLVQATDDYRLVFSEEFSHCDDGIGGLDESLWGGHEHPACKAAGTAVSPCEHIVDGHLFMTHNGACHVNMDTYGKFSFRYGYVEVKFTLPNLLAEYWYSNFAMYFGDLLRQRPFHHERYGIVVDSYEALLTTQGLEADLFEYVSRTRTSFAHQYLNYGPRYYLPWLTPKRSNRIFSLCSGSTKPYGQNFNLEQGTSSRGSCSAKFRRDTAVTMIMGIEWTPRGYRSFLKIEGFHDNLEVIRKKHIDIRHYLVKSTNPDGTVIWDKAQASYSGTDRDSYFEFLNADDPDSVLEQVGISHIPAPIRFSVSGSGSNINAGNRTQPGIKVDYVRIFQPANNYNDMEPLYQ